VMHHPLYSIKGKNNVIQRWMFNDLLRQYGVDLVLQGHEHAYARMTASNEAGIAIPPVYTVSHCSPKNYRIHFDEHFDKFGISSRYYQTVTVYGDTLAMAAYDADTHALYDSLIIIDGSPRMFIDYGMDIPENLDFIPDPNNKKDQQFAKRIEEYKKTHPERLKN
ncbi:MAG: serine/threonine protein phosphatase, partial [Muribaculaceae bacterium]|nr:serine/threonine protein phosphatase [Muribaculaceae bacterium]